MRDLQADDEGGRAPQGEPLKTGAQLTTTK